MYFAIQVKVFNPASKREEWLNFNVAQSPNLKQLLGCHLLDFARSGNFDRCRVKRIKGNEIFLCKREAKQHEAAGLFDCFNKLCQKQT
jgi:hypothetical protein